MNTLTKLAAGDQEFEAGFFQLAYDKIQSKLYNLLPFLVGFQLVKKNEAGTKAVGVFGFKANNGQVIFVPAFFVNGKIKDIDLMYVKNNNQFYPLNEDFASLFLKDGVTEAGSPSKETKPQIINSLPHPNLRDVIWPPRTGRIAYASVMEETNKHEAEFDKCAESMLSPKDYNPAPELLPFIAKQGNQTKQAFWNLMAKEASFIDALHHFYTDEQLADCLRVEKVEPVVKEAKIKLVEFDNVKEAKELDPEHKTKVARDGFAIIDNRSGENISNAGMFSFVGKFTNPSKSGFYPYITEMGTIRYGIVFTNLKCFASGFSAPEYLVLDLEAKNSGQVYPVEPHNIFVKDQIEVKDVGNALKNLEEPAEGLPGYKSYILVNENLVASEPFRILENFKDGNGIRRIKIEPDWAYKRMRGDMCCSKPKSKDVVLVITKRPGDCFEFKNMAVYVPKGFKLLQINTSCYIDTPYISGDCLMSKEDREKKDKANRDEEARIRQGKPGCLHHLTSFLREQNTFPLTVHTNGSEYFVDIEGAKAKFDNAVEAKIAMVMDLGLLEKDAEALLGDLKPNNRKNHGYIKLAVTGEHSLSLQDEQPVTNEFGQPTYFGVPWIDSAPTNDGYSGDPTRIGLGTMPDIQGINAHVNHATQLAQSGQKEVFDTQSIATLARYSDISSKVFEYVPNFVESLDKLGRMLFMAYWDTDKFEKMYGKDELPELMELLKNVFTNLGDLVIFLKRKVPDISINNNEQSALED